MNTISTKKKPAKPGNKKKKVTLIMKAIPPWTKFYYGGRMGYAFEAEPGMFIPLPSEGQVRQHLTHHGVHKKNLGTALCSIRKENLVKWIGPVAGYKTGLHDSVDSGGKILVTEAPKIIDATQGDFPLIERILKGLFDDPDHPLQFHAVMCWLKQARINVKAGKRRPIPVLAIVGPRNSGKSLFLEIARVALGGRSASAYRALTKENGFNSEILGAELLTIDDEVASRDPRARSHFAQALKNVIFSGSVRIEGKNKDAFNARPVHALAVALNDEPEHIRVLPERDESLGDKISLIKAGYADITAAECADREAFFARIMSEMPAFLYYLEGLAIPEQLEDSRTIVGVFVHPMILKNLEDISPEHRLFGLISQCDTVTDSWRVNGYWEGTSAELDTALKHYESPTASEARSLLQWNNSTGTYLGRLSKSVRYPVESGPYRKGNQTWKIKDPDYKERKALIIKDQKLSREKEAPKSLFQIFWENPPYDPESFVGVFDDFPNEKNSEVFYSEDGAMEQVFYY